MSERDTTGRVALMLFLRLVAKAPLEGVLPNELLTENWYQMPFSGTSFFVAALTLCQ
jgi:hypothetical protein